VGIDERRIAVERRFAWGLSYSAEHGVVCGGGSDASDESSFDAGDDAGYRVGYGALGGFVIDARAIWGAGTRWRARGRRI
jgi:hypothetical protein